MVDVNIEIPSIQNIKINDSKHAVTLETLTESK